MNTFSATVLAAIAWIAVSPFASAQQSSLSDQLQIYNGLSSEQQQAILQSLGGGSGTGSGTGSGLGSVLQNRTNGTQSNSLLQTQRMQQRQLLAAQQEAQDRINPTFKPEDTVLVEIGLPGELPPTSSSSQSQDAIQSAVSSGQLSAAQAAAASARLQTQQQQEQQQLQQRQRALADLTPTEKTKLQDVLVNVRQRNPYRLDRDGFLQLPGFAAVALAGLNEEQATKLVSAVPAFALLEIKLTRLPLKKSGTEALKPFGYDIFDDAASNLLPSTDVPVPDDYVVGPGDQISVQLYGSQNQTLNLAVSREGRVSFPQLGPISVGGQRYNAVKNEIEARVARQMIGTRANVSMGETRAINVFVLGEARYPGSYTISGLSTVTSALFAAGGVKPIGSLRNIELKRQGNTVRTLDLYDLLMQGDSSNDIKLLPGDVVFIPPVGPTVSVEGEVQRPAIYELKGNNASVADLIQMAAGLTPQADSSSASLQRVDEQRRRVVINVDPSAAIAGTQPLRNGDALRVARLRPTLDSGVTVQGYVHRPGSFAWREGLKLSDIIPSIDELKPDADQHYVLIRRELPPNRRVAVLSADLAAALRAPGSAADVALMPRDTITVFDLQTSRDNIIRPLMDELRLQSNIDRPTEIVHIEGRIKVPGDYPLEPGMKVGDLIRAGGSLDPSAYGGKAELSRYTVENGEQRRTRVLSIDLLAVMRGDPSADVVLEPFDQLSVKEISGWTDQQQVILRGEVRFPGTYTIQRGETLRSVVARAGGLTDLAFPDGGVFTRRELRVREQEQLDRLAERMKTDIAEVAMMGARAGQAGAAQAVSIGETLLSQLKASTAVGRLVINLDAALHASSGSTNDIMLRDGDELIVPKQRQEVMVLGEVQNVSSHLYQKRLDRDDYIAQSGGTTRQADRSEIYVVRADGSVVPSRSGFLRWGGGTNVSIHPGDAIVVPLDTERLPQLPLWQAVTQIIYNTAVAFAAIHTYL